MPNVENTEAGNQLIARRATRNNLPAKSGSKGQSEDQTPDFLMDVLTKLSGLVKQGSEVKQGNSGEGKGFGQEPLNLWSAESIFPLEQLENIDSVDQALSFQLETTGSEDQIEESGDKEQENKSVPSTSFPPLESLFIGREDILKNFLNKTENADSSLSNAILLMQGEGAVTKSDQSPADGAQGSGQGSGAGSLGLVNPKGEIPIERPSNTGVFLQGAGLNSGLSQAPLLREGEDSVTKTDRSFVDGAWGSGRESGEGSPGLGDPNREMPIERPSDTGIFLQVAGPNSGLSQASLLSDGEGPVTEADRSPVKGARVSGQGSGAGSPGLVNPKGEIPIEGTSDTGIFLKVAIPNSRLSQASLLSDGEGPVTEPDRSPVEGVWGSGKESGAGSPGLVNPTEESPVERGETKRSHDLKDGLSPRLDDTLFLNKLKTFVEKISQPLADGPARNRVDPEEGRSGFKKSIEHTSEKDNFPRERLSAEKIKIPLAQDRQSSDSIMIEKAEGAPSEKRKEGQPGLSSLIKEGFSDTPRGFSVVKDREGPEIVFDIKGLTNKDMTLTGENLPGNGSRQSEILPIVPNDQTLRESIVTEKSIKNNPEQLNHFPKTYELDFLKDHYFSVKKQTSSSMEISLEPAGLGKLDIELNLNQDRLQGQIMVNDKAGKELIERNLPQLLTDLTREGLQIGGFTVSLKNQGRGQNPIPIRTEFEEPPLRPVSPEIIVPIQGNHLIHIII